MNDRMPVKALPAGFVPVHFRSRCLSGYAVDRVGRMWSLRSGRCLKPYIIGKGYLGFALRHDGETIRATIHAIVAEAFIGPRPDGCDVCHNGGDRTNNAVSNLRYDTRAGNLADREKHGTAQVGERNPAATLSDSDAADLRRLRADGLSLAVLGRKYHVATSTVSRIANGVRRAPQAKGGEDGDGAAEGSVPVGSYFGGKSQVADLVWSRLGDVRNYVEPFAGSLAALLRRPEPGKVETVNDLHSFIPNFWRAVKHDPDAVAEHADWPVSEADLHARHRWLVSSDAAVAAMQRVKADPDFYDAKIAGWWCWGACCWIGSGWCDENRLSPQLPQIAGKGGSPVNGGVLSWAGFRAPHQKRPQIGGWNGEPSRRGVLNNLPSEKLPRIDVRGAGYGVTSGTETDGHRPDITSAYARGKGVNSHDAAETCRHRREWITEWMRRLSDRLRPVRVCCGHWARVCDSESTMTRLGTTGVFLDPPYRQHIDGVKSRATALYANDRTQNVGDLCDEVQDWCLRWGDNPQVRIVLCGLSGEYPSLDDAGWECVAWKSRGGYGNRTDAGKANAARERLWLSPACVPVQAAAGLFDAKGAA